MKFKQWLQKEMASFMLPDTVRIMVPTKDHDEKMIAVDMYFEKQPQDIDKVSGTVMNQGSKFVAKVPYGNKYFVYNGLDGALERLVNKEEAEELIRGEHNLLPDTWWKKAMIIGSDMQPVET